jgi:hypothetical protein
MSVVKKNISSRIIIEENIKCDRYLFLREAVAVDIVRIAYKPGGSNKVDILT